MFCKVAFAVPLRKLFDYSIPEELTGRVTPGVRVCAPFGKAFSTGIVVELSPTVKLPPFIQIKAITSVLDSRPLFGTEILGLGSYISERWCSPLGEAMGVLLPDWVKELDAAGLQLQAEKTERLAVAGERKKKTAPEPELPPPAAEPDDVWKGTLFESVPAPVATVFSPDMLSAPDMEAMLSAFDEKPFEDAGTGDSARVVSFFKTDAVVPVGSEPVPQETAAAPEQEQTAPSPVYSGPRTLTQDQSAALEKLGPLVREKKRGVSLLFGDSLTGKTEIFLQLMQTALACGRQSLLLLPDIVLTQPFMDEISARLGADRTVLWHSRLTARQKNIIFNRLSSGESVVVAGTRSACLLPFKNLGVVFVDEEHDDSYKQEDQKPYYHAREVAVWRGGFHGCPVVFSSAVPSMETLRFATEGRIALIRLSQTVRKAAMPSVILTGKKGAKSPYISDVLYDKLDSTLARRQQAMLIINRLGYAAAYACLNCGWSLPCPKCGRTMGKQAEGQETAHLKCGFCGTKADLPKECPKCRNRVFKTVGSGTQRAIVEVQKLFPDARIVRVDSDTIKGKKSEGFTAWQQINSDNADIIIGTKLITRGYRFPKLSLAAFIDADTELNFPDFRASEKTCQMLFQAKGRLLYGTGDPVFIIQTAKADDAAFQAVVAGDYLAFGKEELQLRKDLSYPPYSRIIRVTVRAQNASSALKICGEVSASAAGVSADGRFAEGKDFEVMGPTACYQPKTAKGAYYQFLFKSADSDFASELMNAVSKIKVRRPAVIKIIADPSDFH